MYTKPKSLLYLQVGHGSTFCNPADELKPGMDNFELVKLII